MWKKTAFFFITLDIMHVDSKFNQKFYGNVVSDSVDMAFRPRDENDILDQIFEK